MLSAHPQSPHLHPPPSAPTKASLKTWWNHFTFVQRTKKDAISYVREYEKGSSEDHPVFGKPLAESLKYASVPISTANHNGDLYVWGYVPVVVAKCGLYLKENATEVPGTFRVNGSNKRMRELQLQFETPPKYGKNLDWKQETYTTHDVASVFRRYLTQMPEPVIPHRLYHKFRDALAKEPHSQEAVIAEYKALIRQMSQAHQYLLLYVLDLLSVFARKSDKNLMTATNLAVIFRPGILSHPSHEMAPPEHALSQRVLEFLIANQDWFMLDTPSPNPNLVSPPLNSSSAPHSSSSNPPYHSSSFHPNPNSHNTSNLSSGHGHIPPSSAPVYGSSILYNVQPPPASYDHTRFGSTGVHWGGGGAGGGEGVWGGGEMTEKDIQREQERIKMMRRRTTLERGEPGMYGALEEGLESGSESPSSSHPHYHNPNNPILNGGAGVTVARSRTLPSGSSRTKRGGGASGSNPNVNITTPAATTDKEKEGKKDERERSRLLKKQKRASMVTPTSQASSTIGAATTTTTTAVGQPQSRRTSQILGGGSSGH